YPRDANGLLDHLHPPRPLRTPRIPATPSHLAPSRRLGAPYRGNLADWQILTSPPSTGATMRVWPNTGGDCLPPDGSRIIERQERRYLNMSKKRQLLQFTLLTLVALPACLAQSATTTTSTCLPLYGTDANHPN